MKKIILFGKNGQVGKELQHTIKNMGMLISYGRSSANFENLSALKKIIKEEKPDIIINAAAYTAVDRAEDEQKKAKLINTDAVALLAEETKKLNGLLIHYSTDYVFDGKKNLEYRELDATNPQNIYGQTKRDGENAIQSINCKHLIFRTSWVYSNYGHNFIKTIVKVAKIKTELKIINDQTSTPTSAEFIADVTAHCLNDLLLMNNELMSQKSGIYHLSPNGKTNWYEYAKFIISELSFLGVHFKTPTENIFPITSAELKTAATRPLYSKLNTDKISSTFNLDMMDWHVPLRKVLSSLAEQNQ